MRAALLLLLPAVVQAQAPPPEIDLYTMGPGEEVFTRFGHAAICVTDEKTPQGRCYNYGTADFSTPVPLTWSFVRGRALFWVSVQDLPRMVAFYVAQDRTLYRQRLRLPPQQARQLAAALEASTAQSVRYYRYHHFYDNCTTRIRDLLDRVTGGALSRGAQTAQGPTFRSYARSGFAGDLPLLLAAELLLGRSADARTSPWQAMFLPEVLRREVAARLGAEPEVVYARKAPLPGGSTRLAQLALGGTGLLLALVTLALRRTGRLALAPAAAVLGLGGVLLWGLAVLSSFPELRWNEALLCLWPTDLLLPLLPASWLWGYVRVRLVALLALGPLAGAGVLVQPLLPLVLLTGLPMATAWYVLARGAAGTRR
ncbi:MAG: DUF4105 domain-containing protein [Myxococcota bacterium]|nr:DUF4105 domain-containing protein [Myxococcota bacterium]